MNSRREILSQLLILVLTVGLFYTFFSLFQQEWIYGKTLGRVVNTYQKLEGEWNIAFEKKPYKPISDSLLVNWDVAGYDYLRTHRPSEENVRSSYGFFPMFPWVWKLTHLPARYIGIFNFFLFGIGWMVVMRLFLNPAGWKTRERLLIFLLGISVPSVAVFLIPYSEALFMFLFVIAIAGLPGRRYWLYFIFMTMAAMTRASVVIVIASMAATSAWFLIRTRNYRRLIPEAILLMLPLVTGMVLVFLWQYHYSGNFFKYYEVQSTYWTNNLQWPVKLGDWSVEGFGMNIAAIFLLVIPSLIWLFSDRGRMTGGETGMPAEGQDPKIAPGKERWALFGGDPQQIKAFFTVNAVTFFAGFFLYVLMFRGGSIHCLHRFIVSSPYFYIFLCAIAGISVKIPRKRLLSVLIPLITAGLLFILIFPIDRGIHFRDSGFVLFSLVVFTMVFFRDIGTRVRTAVAAGTFIYAVIWFTYLYNSYISCAWIWA